MKKIRLFLVDDHRLVTESWALLLSSDPRFEVIGYSCQADQALAFIRQYPPDVVLTDISMTPYDGIELTTLIHKYCPDIKVIGVSFHCSAGYAKKMIAAGAQGYLSKASSKDELYQAILDVASGKRYISHDVRDKIVEEQLLQSSFSNLTSKELQIISLLREGMTSKEIATKEKVSCKTVEVHRYNILKKLRLPNIAALISTIHARGL